MRMSVEEAMKPVATLKEGLLTVERVAVVELQNWKLCYLAAFVAPWMEVEGRVGGGR